MPCRDEEAKDGSSRELGGRSSVHWPKRDGGPETIDDLISPHLTSPAGRDEEVRADEDRSRLEYPREIYKAVVGQHAFITK